MLRLGDYEAARDGKLKPPKWMEPFRVDIPEGKRGVWKVERFNVEMNLENLRMMRDGRGCFPGTYTRLSRNGYVVMSDTTAEINDHSEVYHRAKGRVLINGLGLGCILKAILTKPEVEHIDVVEMSGDVLWLVGRHFDDDPRVDLHAGDAMTFKFPRGSRWDVAWHDIWDDICADNLPEMEQLRKRYAGKAKWQGFWGKEYIRR